MSSSQDTTPDESDKVRILRRSLAETEARVISRLIVSAQQIIPKEYLESFLQQFKNNSSLDMLEIERQIADTAKEKADILSELFETVKNYKWSVKHLNEIRYAQGIDADAQSKLVEEEKENIRIQQKMFSLVDEIELKERMYKEISNY